MSHMNRLFIRRCYLVSVSFCSGLCEYKLYAIVANIGTGNVWYTGGHHKLNIKGSGGQSLLVKLAAGFCIPMAVSKTES
jgi:hypothetical protein